MMHKAGLEVDEDLLVPVMSSARRRLFWLGLYMGTAFLAAWVIGLFEARLDQIVASMGRYCRKSDPDTCHSWPGARADHRR